MILISSKNPDLQFQRNADGTLVIMPPTGGISGNREAKAGAYLLSWLESQDLDEVFGPTTGFKANTAIKSPDAAFVARGRLAQNWDEGEDGFLNLAPDFAMEIRSKTDTETLQAKMGEYIDNGCDWDGCLTVKISKLGCIGRMDR